MVSRCCRPQVAFSGEELRVNPVICCAGALYRFPGKHLLSSYGSAITVGHLQFTELCCAASPFWLTDPESSS